MSTYINSKELMETLNISRTTLYRMEQEGLPYTLVGKSKRYTIPEVQVWMNARQRGISTLIVGQHYDNDTISKVFKCGNMGGMRRSHTTNALVIFSDHTKGLYEDRWQTNGEEDILHYTGMGQTGHQDINFAQNKTLNESQTNGVRVYLFETFVEGEHIFRGQVELAGDPYQEIQNDIDDQPRNVWIFPLRIVGGSYILPQKAIAQSQEVKDGEANRLNDEELARRAKKAVKSSKRTVTTEAYERNPYVSEHAKRRANGICELCEEPAPFDDKKGEPFLHTHHVTWLSKGGEDTIYNTVAVCPNCHSKLHVLDLSEDVKKLKDKLDYYKKIDEQE